MANELQNSLFDTIKQFMKASESESNATKVIECLVVECLDDATGLYKVSYQNNTFNAYSANNTTYSPKDKVYVLIPNISSDKQRIIIGGAFGKPPIVTNNDIILNYEDVSENLIDVIISDDGVIKLSSYEKTISSPKDITGISADIFGEIFQGYLENYNNFVLSFEAKTFLETSRQTEGNYGVEISIPVITKEGVRTELKYQLDVSNMLGTPYQFMEWTPQDLLINIDTSKYDYDSTKKPTFSYYCYDFTPLDAEKAKEIKDIWLKDISFKVIEPLTESDYIGYNLKLVATQGVFFADNYKFNKKITPVLRINGKETSLKDSEMYWFIEDSSIAVGSKYYTPYGGVGWKCLNPSTVRLSADDGTEIYDYTTNIYELNVSKDSIFTSARYKCVYLRDGITSTQTIELFNINSDYDIKLYTKNGYTNTFIKDTGTADLVLSVYIKDYTKTTDNKNNLIYSWLRYDKDNRLMGNEHITMISYNQVQEDRYISEFSIPVDTIDEYNTFYCSIKKTYMEGNRLVEYLLGTRKIVLATEVLSGYRLTIENDNILYKYDVDGDSPAGAAYDGPSTSKVTSIQPLQYTVRKPDGVELTDAEYKKCKWKWIISKESLFIPEAIVTGAEGFNNFEDSSFYYIEGYGKGSISELQYKLAERYNMTKKHGGIGLEVTFNDQTLYATAALTVTKEGEGGSNGTSYAAQIVWGGSSATDKESVPYGTLDLRGVAKKLRLVYFTSNNSLKVWSYGNFVNTLGLSNDSRLFKLYTKVFLNGHEYDGNYTVKYSMFDEKGTSPCLTIDNNGVISRKIDSQTKKEIPITTQIIDDKGNDITPCNIVQAEIEFKNDKTNKDAVTNHYYKIYAYYPIELTVVDGASDTGLLPVLDGGFSEVMYASDGTNPSWDETRDFELKFLGLSALENQAILGDRITWNAQNHLSLVKNYNEVENTLALKLKPDNKFNDGTTKNYVTGFVNVNSNIFTDISEKIQEYAGKEQSAAAQKEQSQKEEQYLIDLGSKYNKNKWINDLESIQGLLDNRNAAIHRLNSLLTDCLIDFEHFYTNNIQNNPSIVSTFKPFRDRCGALKNKCIEALDIVCKGVNNANTYSKTLIDLNNYLIEFKNDNIAEIIRNNVKYETYILLQTIIDKIIIELEKYQESILTIKQNKDTVNYLNKYIQVKTEIEEMLDAIKPDAPVEQRAMKNKIEYYLNSFEYYYVEKDDNGNILEVKDINTSLKDLKNIINNIEEKVLRNTFVVKDNKYVLNESVSNEYKSIQERYSNEIERYNTLKSDYQKLKNNNTNISIRYTRPIVLYFNRYSMSNINEWDGNKIYTGNNDEYLLAPQVGAGYKNNDNSFTGIVIGQRITSSKTNQAGVFGYSSGKQSLFLDANKGSAIFGISGNGGQVIIDPEAGGKIFSSNFFILDAYDIETGVPKTAAYDNTSYWSNNGILLDLQAGEMYAGDYFRLENTGTLKIGKNVKKNSTNSTYWTITGNSDYPYIGYNGNKFGWSGGTSSYISGNTQSVYLGTDGLRLGSKFAVNNKGEMVCTSAYFTSSSFSGSVTTGPGSSINGTYITSNSITTNHIQANAVTAAKIQANTITADEIAAGAIGTKELAAGAVTATNIAANAITGDKIYGKMLEGILIKGASFILPSDATNYIEWRTDYNNITSKEDYDKTSHRGTVYWLGGESFNLPYIHGGTGSIDISSYTLNLSEVGKINWGNNKPVADVTLPTTNYSVTGTLSSLIVNTTRLQSGGSHLSIVGGGTVQFDSSHVHIRDLSVTGTFAQSDKRVKRNIKNIDQQMIRLIDKINFKSFILKNDDNNKIRFGVIAQDIIAEMKKNNLKIEDYSIIFKNNDDMYSVSYNDLFVLKIAALEEKIKRLEDSIK